MSSVGNTGVGRSLSWPTTVTFAGEKASGLRIWHALLLADIAGLAIAFLGALVVWDSDGPAGAQSGTRHLVLFVLVLCCCVLTAKLLGLYDRDCARADHSTVDDLVGVFEFVTTGVWIAVVAGLFGGSIEADIRVAATLWALALVAVPAARAVADATIRHQPSYLQNTLIVGAGDVGQLVARKLTRHPEYGLHPIGFVDDAPKRRPGEVHALRVVGSPKELRSLVRDLQVDRVIIAFSSESTESTLQIVRDLENLDVQIDVVPRLFEILGPKVLIHRIEGLPLTGLPPAHRSRWSFRAKRAADVLLSAVALLLVSPLMAYIAWRVKRDDSGPIFFRQIRLGLHMREFTALKFRTMKVDTDPEQHRRYIRELAAANSATSTDGLFKLEQNDAITPFGRWLRKSSLDELPQLINVLRGDMSLVGPRPCIPYEIETFEPHHFERFLVPAGITGLWQVTARANSTFEEALEMDVAYVHAWSLGLDLRLLLRTPFQLLRQRGSTT